MPAEEPEYARCVGHVRSTTKRSITSRVRLVWPCNRRETRDRPRRPERTGIAVRHFAELDRPLARGFGCCPNDRFQPCPRYCAKVVKIVSFPCHSISAKRTLTGSDAGRTAGPKCTIW